MLEISPYPGPGMVEITKEKVTFGDIANALKKDESSAVSSIESHGRGVEFEQDTITHEFPKIIEEPEVLLSTPPTKKPRLTLDKNYHVHYKGEGTYQYASKQNYKLSQGFTNHEAEHSIGIDVIINPYRYVQDTSFAPAKSGDPTSYPDGSPFLELNSAAKPTGYSRADYPKLENAAPAYQEFKPLHRAHIGTGVGAPVPSSKGVEGIATPTVQDNAMPRPSKNSEQKNFDSGYYPNRYRAEQRSSIERGNVGEAIALNQEVYANSPVFRFFYRSEILQNDGSWLKIAEGSERWINEASKLGLTHDLQAINIPLRQSPQQIIIAMDRARKNINESYYLQTKLPDLHWVEYSQSGTATIRTTQIEDKHRIEIIRARKTAISGNVPSIDEVFQTTQDFNLTKGDGTAFTLQDIAKEVPPTETDKVKIASDVLSDRDGLNCTTKLSPIDKINRAIENGKPDKAMKRILSLESKLVLTEPKNQSKLEGVVTYFAYQYIVNEESLNGMNQMTIQERWLKEVDLPLRNSRDISIQDIIKIRQDFPRMIKRLRNRPQSNPIWASIDDALNELPTANLSRYGDVPFYKGDYPVNPDGRGVVGHIEIYGCADSIQQTQMALDEIINTLSGKRLLEDLATDNIQIQLPPMSEGLCCVNRWNQIQSLRSDRLHSFKSVVSCRNLVTKHTTGSNTIKLSLTAAL